MYFKSKLCCLLFASLLLMSSCEKEPLLQQQNQLTESTLRPSCDDCGEGCVLSSVLEAIKDPVDIHNDQINMMLYHYGEALRVALKKPSYRQLILDRLSSQNTTALSLLDLAQEHSAFAAYLNEELRQSMAAKNIYPRGVEEGVETLIATPGWDANSYLTERMIHSGYSYHPVVYEMKTIETSNENPLTILIAQEVNDCDDVAGWRGDTEILVSEAEAESSEDIMLFVAPGKGLALAGVEEIVESSVRVGEAGERTVMMDEQLRAVSGKVKGLDYRFEKTGKSEIIAFVTGWTDDPKNPLFKSNQQGQTKFSKKDIKDHKTVTINKSIAGVIESPLATNFFVGFYEYDWYIREQNLKEKACPCNSSVPDAKLSMKYNHEYYNLDLFCGRFTTLIPRINGTKTLDNKRGTFVLKREAAP